MMSTWLIVFCVMLAGSMVLRYTPLDWYVPMVLFVNFQILLASYFLFRNDRTIDLRSNMLFMFGLTVINALMEMGIMSHTMTWIAFGALLVWSMLGGGRK